LSTFARIRTLYTRKNLWREVILNFSMATANTSTPSSLPSNAKEAPKSFVRRDKLLSIEKEVQKYWETEREFESDAGNQGDKKYMCTFPYPYMNGRLHLGHSFTVSKAEFAAGYKRLKGYKVLFPFAFHCTGMPIQAAANRLKREIETGAHLKALQGGSTGSDSSVADADAPEPEPVQPPQPPTTVEIASTTLASQSTTSTTTTTDDKVKELGKFTGKKTKAVAKGTAGATVTQYEILLRSGIPPEDIPAFQDPTHWLKYFPPLGEVDLRGFGSHIDWRRAFITTDANLYYDSFIRWQFQILRKRDKIGFGKRPTIFSPIDGQACADHDRASGEGVGAQEYSLIKIKVKSIPTTHKFATTLKPLSDLIASGRNVYFVAATLRPETMYGQTNCFLLPEGEYGAFDVGIGGEKEGGDVYLCSERSAKNMSYQRLSPARGVTLQLGTFTGEELLGLPLSAPLAQYETVYTLPLLTISMGKGTGVVTSVPSDAPDDWAALRDLKEKPKLREKYGITDEMVNFDIVEIIDIPGFGRRAALTICDTLGIKSQNDKEKLKEAKEAVYQAGFYQGIMLMGKHAGKKVCDAKPLVRGEMIAAGLACAYWEPESLVMSRSGDECVVAELDQWYLKYGHDEWRGATEAWVKGGGFNAYSPLSQQAFEFTLSWLQEWACSRSFGLGTRLPWDPQFVIESLSDSTIYMAYYTVAHLLHQGSLDGSKGPGPLGITPDQLSDDMWDYVFLADEQSEAEAAAERAINASKNSSKGSLQRSQLDAMRKEFRFWYPMDLRVSGRDLIQNHLTMSLYNHVAVWGARSDRCPQSFFCNGHVLVDGEKMSKSKGNFLMLHEAVARWSADATRFALADAGDSLEDANFERDRADGAILRLTTEEEYVKEIIALANDGKLRGSSSILPSPTLDPIGHLTALEHDSSLKYADRVFLAKINVAIRETDANYESMKFREALKFGFYELQLSRDSYRDTCEKMGISVHKDVMMRLFEVQTILLAPICPHWCEYMWGPAVLNLRSQRGNVSVTRTQWPIKGVEDEILLKSDTYLSHKIHQFRIDIIKSMTVKASKAARGIVAQPKPTDAIVYVATRWPSWQKKPLAYLASVWDPVVHATTGGFPADVIKEVQKMASTDPELKPFMKKIMPLASTTVQDMAGRSEKSSILAMQLPFDEYAVWTENADFVKRALDLSGSVIVYKIDDDSRGPLSKEEDPAGKAKDVLPLEPDIHAYAVTV
jgi:leucyl-tRNA synthetase